MSKPRNYVTDEELEKEIKKLNESELVKLARTKRRNDYRRRQYLYQLRNLEKEGKKLKDAGITIEMLCNEDSDYESDYGC